MFRRLFYFLVLLSVVPFASVRAFEKSLPALNESPAYKQYSRQPKSELSKLIYLLNRLKETKFLVVYNAHEYKAEEASRLAKDFLKRNYHQETADYWIKKYGYKTDHGNVILFKDRAGEVTPAREIVLEELDSLLKASSPPA